MPWTQGSSLRRTCAPLGALAVAWAAFAPGALASGLPAPSPDAPPVAVAPEPRPAATPPPPPAVAGTPVRTPPAPPPVTTAVRPAEPPARAARRARPRPKYRAVVAKPAAVVVPRPLAAHDAAPPRLPRPAGAERLSDARLALAGAVLLLTALGGGVVLLAGRAALRSATA